MAMEQSIWVILTAVFAASTAGLAVVLVVINRGPRNTPRPDGRETYVEYGTPDYLGYRDFRLDGLPDTDTLTPTRYCHGERRRCGWTTAWRRWSSRWRTATT